MKRMYVVGLCLVAVVAFSAVAAGSAFAEPEFTNSTHAFPLAFTSVGGKAELTTKEHTVECEKVLDEGQILNQPSSSSSMLGDIKFLFDKCKLVGGGKCGNHPNLASEKIVTPEYLWHLGSLTTAPNGLRAVLILVLVHPKTIFSCESIIGNVTIEVEGNVVGLILDANAAGEPQFNVRRKTIEVEFKQKEAGVQEDRRFEFTLPTLSLFPEELDLKSTTKTPLGEATELAAEVATGTETVDGEVELKA